jgi:bile acid:Na+ symporter, BASS family
MKPVNIVAFVFLASLTIAVGLQVNIDHLKAILRNYGLLSRAILANFIIVPFLGVLLARWFELPGPVATGFLLMAIAPGVPFILLQVRKRGGSLGLAVALEFLLPLISIVTVPITAELVLPDPAKAALPMSKFVVTLLLSQLLPLLAGILVVARSPELAARLLRPMKIVAAIALLVLVVMLAPKIGASLAAVYGSRGMLAAFCLVVLSLIIGGVLGGREREERRVLAFGTALRNIGLCALIATTGFAETPLVIATVLSYFVIQFVTTSLVGVYFKRTANLPKSAGQASHAA